MSFDKSNMVLLIIGYSSNAPPSASKVSASKFKSSELVATSVIPGYGVLDLLPTVALRYGTFLLIIANILIAFSGS